MNYSANIPNSENTKRPITEAEIVKQGYELEAQDIRANRLMAHQALVADAESVRLIGDLLTGYGGSTPSVMDSEILKSALRIEDRAS